MPLFFRSFLPQDCRLAVWHITEDEAFFRMVAAPQRSVRHPHKRLQHLAGRFLLRHLAPDFPTELIQIAGTRKPYLPDDTYHFSISHCSDYAAAIISRTARVGVDIEVITNKAARIRPKFAAAEEWNLVQSELLKVPRRGLNDSYMPDSGFGDDALAATLLWSCKEAVFKWYGASEVDFIKHINIKRCQIENEAVVVDINFVKESAVLLQVHAVLMQDIWLSYVVG